MFTPTNADADLTTTAHQAEVCTVQYWQDSDNWTPDDIIQQLETSGKYGHGYFPEEAKALCEIVFKKMINWLKDEMIGYEKVSELFDAFLNPNNKLSCLFALSNYAASWMPKLTCNFLKEFVQICKTDNYYYELLYRLLATQTVKNQLTPMAACLEHHSYFMEDVFKQLPKNMQKQLRQDSYYIYDDDTDRLTCYQLIGGGSVSM